MGLVPFDHSRFYPWTMVVLEACTRDMEPCSRWHPRGRAGLEAPTSEGEVNRHYVCRTQSTCGTRWIFARPTRVFGRQLRLPSSLLEDDFIDPYTIVQDATHEMRRSDALRMAAAHGAQSPPSDVDSIPQPTTEATAGTCGWRTGLHTQTEGWSSRTVWTWRVRLSEEPKPGGNEDSLRAHAELLAQVQSLPGEARDQRRSERNRDRYITAAETD